MDNPLWPLHECGGLGVFFIVPLLQEGNQFLILSGCGCSTEDQLSSLGVLDCLSEMGELSRCEFHAELTVIVPNVDQCSGFPSKFGQPDLLGRRSVTGKAGVQRRSWKSNLQYVSEFLGQTS